MATGSSHSINICPPHSPTQITKNSILKLAGAFHWPNTSRIRFWAFSYSMGEPCGRSNQLITYFMFLSSLLCKFVAHRKAVPDLRSHMSLNPAAVYLTASMRPLSFVRSPPQHQLTKSHSPKRHQLTKSQGSVRALIEATGARYFRP